MSGEQEMARPGHGGGVRAAALRYGIAVGEWLELSTGLNPVGFPAPVVPGQAWLRLPEEGDGLEDAAAGFYGRAGGLPVAGSQAAIQALPFVLPPVGRVAMLEPTYAEHPWAWRGVERVGCADAAALEAALPSVGGMVLVNPNNPTGERVAPERVLAWCAALAGRGGWLVVDEAFMDATPEGSVLAQVAAGTWPRGLVVLRSVGKFFGLAGARAGFVFAEDSVRTALAQWLGPWALAGPSRWVVRAALRDGRWQREARARLRYDSERLGALLARFGLVSAGRTACFQWVPTPHAARLADAFARRAILVRHFAAPQGLRFGLPADEAGWQRLEQALRGIHEPSGLGHNEASEFHTEGC